MSWIVCLQFYGVSQIIKFRSLQICIRTFYPELETPLDIHIRIEEFPTRQHLSYSLKKYKCKRNQKKKVINLRKAKLDISA